MATVYDDVPPRVHDAPPPRDRRSSFGPTARPGVRASAARVVGTVKAVAPPVASGAAQLGVLTAQVIATGAALSVAATILLLGSGYADGGVGPFLLCLLAAVVASAISTVFVVVLGVPLRFTRRARLWWIRNGEVALAGTLVGAGLLIASAILGGGGAPNGWLLVPGWLLLAFSLAHTWWPDRWRPERLRTKRPEPRVRVAGHAPGDRRRRARAAVEEFLAASGRAFRGERD
ncbi:hypothetical protein QCD70_02165 [Agreia sp. PsM10]|uniref:hypothetical protein n=1 Tax=Agreia sp. PsM10 TaxID=3030533 RepID=UPI00263AF159|nr:hypothetical protein [Agreia sp. PsM10]MDN4639041.1 hypothetical protein [Agreia sp. PsM10]